MVDRDLAIGAVGASQTGVPTGAVYAGGLTAGSTVSKKPCYLLTLEEVRFGKTKLITRFILIDKPDILNGFVQVKGIYSDFSEDDIVKRFWDIIQTTPKEQQLEIMFPTHRVVSIRSLMFNAVKPIMVNK
jgi:hypothetical protein